jgi:hypothetical protein
LTESRIPPRVDQFLRKLSRNISEAIESGAIELDWLSSTKGNHEYTLHSRVLGILVKTGFGLRGYTVGVEAGFKQKGHLQFKPDLQLWKADRLQFLIEYESTNSSNRHVFEKDVRRYVDSLDGEPLPRHWLVIYTLPDTRVERPAWKFYGLKKSTPLARRILKAPHGYYKELLARTLTKMKINATDGQDGKIFFINLTEHGLEIDFPKKLSRKYPFKLRRSKR